MSIAAAVTAIPRNLGLHTTTAECMPSDFPRYSPAQRAFGFTVGPICSEAYTTSDSVDQVTSFYQEQLQAWPWRVTRFTSTPPTIYFGRQDSAQAAGEVQDFATQTGSRFTITYSP